MPASELWLNEAVIEIKWQAPLSEHDVEDCFAMLYKHISEAGGIPLQAPTLFLRSHVFSLENFGEIVVYGMNPNGKVLGRIAATMTGVAMSFYDTEAEARAHFGIA